MIQLQLLDSLDLYILLSIYLGLDNKLVREALEMPKQTYSFRVIKLFEEGHIIDVEGNKMLTPITLKYFQTILVKANTETFLLDKMV